ncbi:MULTISPECIES: hypothetical protein [Streptomyces]|uniref:hypothetical protein n=1 Tax=Streptomyces TaxID=1883 RepID=UPI00117D9070|nr:MULTISPECIES: hypothetical protein [unclassified Streptomyces]WTE24095.1 hypothetical protein OHB50_00110 [Streptomyces anulatus]WTE31197.1 hypothetical protein OHB50_38770 [Streptomyces anulatus]
MTLILTNLLSAYVAYGALVTQPQGAWDESTLTGIEFASALLITLSILTSLLALVPVVRHTRSRWWLAPSLTFLALGVARWVYIIHTYPLGPGG